MKHLGILSLVPLLPALLAAREWSGMAGLVLTMVAFWATLAILKGGRELARTRQRKIMGRLLAPRDPAVSPALAATRMREPELAMGLPANLDYPAYLRRGIPSERKARERDVNALPGKTGEAEIPPNGEPDLADTEANGMSEPPPAEGPAPEEAEFLAETEADAVPGKGSGIAV